MSQALSIVRNQDSYMARCRVPSVLLPPAHSQAFLSRRELAMHDMLASGSAQSCFAPSQSAGR